MKKGQRLTRLRNQALLPATGTPHSDSSTAVNGVSSPQEFFSIACSMEINKPGETAHHLNLPLRACFWADTLLADYSIELFGGKTKTSEN